MATAERDLSEMIAELGLDRQNRATLGRMVSHGGLAHATEMPDGRMHAEIRIVPDQLVWDPSILVMPHGGDIEVDLFNDDSNTHCALMPSNGDSQWIWLPVYSKGKVHLNLDGPGYYWFSSNVGNDEGRGLVGAIVVQGDVPVQGRLDRPDQPRP
ncbi:MSMEG_3727 family PQQ-associated protein [Saccharopolyspora griseoalba]|uniref:MSMEG_3727 family PQQ-associated protein n=1 Tax=Saccharopolyspora griseoalba TaxID=1431848 RepID=A0ABW2LKP2_9PSEU